MKLNSSMLKWVCIALIIKAVFFVFFHYHFLRYWPAQRIVRPLFIGSGDTPGYFEPLENLVNGHGYSVTVRDGSGGASYQPFAGRMPGFLPVYVPLFYFFGKEAASAALIIFQFLLNAFSVYLLSQAAERLFKTKLSFYITFFLSAAGCFDSVFVHYGLSESLSASFLVFSFYMLMRISPVAGYRDWMWAGFFLAWAVFLRPVLAIFLILFPLIGWIRIRLSPPGFLKACVFFLLPFMIADVCWIIRNYSSFGRFVILQNTAIGPGGAYTGDFPEQKVSLKRWVIAVGGDCQEWEPAGEMGWFYLPPGKQDAVMPFTAKDFTPRYNTDSLLRLRDDFRSSLDENIPGDKRMELAKSVIAACERYRLSYISCHPVYYYFLNRLRICSRILFIRRLDHLPFPASGQMNMVQKAVKGGYFLFYYFVIASALAGMAAAVWKKNRNALLVALVVMSYVFLFGFVLGFVESRYLVPVYPFLILLSSFAAATGISRIWRRSSESE